MKKLLLIALLSISINYADEFNGLKGVYVDDFGKKVLKVDFGDNTGMMFINGRVFDCGFFESYSYFSKNYKWLYRTSWKPPHSFIYMYKYTDYYCEKEGSKGILFVIIENDGWIFDNYSEIVAISNVSFRNITKVVDDPLRYGKLLTKD